MLHQKKPPLVCATCGKSFDDMGQAAACPYFFFSLDAAKKTQQKHMSQRVHGPLMRLLGGKYAPDDEPRLRVTVQRLTQLFVVFIIFFAGHPRQAYIREPEGPVEPLSDAAGG